MMAASAEDNLRLNDPRGAAAERALAEGHARRAAELQALPGPVVRGIGGEVTLEDPSLDPIPGYGYGFKDTLECPSSTSAAASRARMAQVQRIGGTDDTLAQALDAAETIGARDSLERMAAHQLAALHGLAMQLLRDGAEMIGNRGKGQVRNGSPFDAMEFYNVEGCRLLSTAARLMGAFQNGHATLARLRQGGRQVVTVQHVTVTQGGQAVVAGHVGAGGGGGKRGGRGKTS